MRARERGLGFTLISAPYPVSVATVCFHHITDEYVIPVPRDIHNSAPRDYRHRGIINQWISQQFKYYGIEFVIIGEDIYE